MLHFFQLLVPLATIQYWNSKSSYPFGFRDGHSPLIDSIMIGNLDIVQLLIPLTDLISGSHIHAAVRYGRFEIFKHLCGHFNDWKKVKNKRGSTIYQVLVDKNYLIEVNDMEPGPICRSPKFAEKGLSEEFQHKMLNFINENWLPWNSLPAHVNKIFYQFINQAEPLFIVPYFQAYLKVS